MRLFAFAIAISTGLTVCAQDRDKRIDQLLREKFAARLNWETLWEAPADSQALLARSAQLQLMEKGHEISFCSSELQECRRYDYQNYQLLEELDYRAMNPGEAATEALFRFTGEPVPPTTSSSHISSIYGGELSMTAKYQLRMVIVRLETRPQVLTRYKDHKPDEKAIHGVRTYLTQDRDSKMYFRSLTVASFLDRDPEIVLFGKRRDDVSVVFSIRWDAEAETWRDGWFIDSNQDPEEVERYRQIVEAISCLRITFDN